MYKSTEIYDDKPHEECGVFGIFDHNLSAVHEVYYGIFALQHRGQESAGITVTDGKEMETFRGMGLVTEVFRNLPEKEGHIGIGHVRYSTTGSSIPANVQPLQADSIDGPMALAHNGNLVNTLNLRRRLLLKGSTFSTSMDTEVIIKLLARSRRPTEEEKFKELMDEIHGAYAIVACTNKALYGCRDPFGYRPLVLGKTETGWVLASETPALDAIDAKFVRDILPGEIVSIDDNGVRSTMYCPVDAHKHGICSFEYIYFARPDSVIDGAGVHEARQRAGAFLALEHPVSADVVVGAPDSGLDAAMGYARQSGIPYQMGFIKNRYVGRTFIEPTQQMREDAVRIKLSAIKSVVEGKRVILVDDSIVRGTTCARTVRILRQAGAKEVHLRISSPMFVHPCYFGTDVPSEDKLVACRLNHDVQAMAKEFNVDSLGFLDVDDTRKIAVGCGCEFCVGCFTGEYPVDPPKPQARDKYLDKYEE